MISLNFSVNKTSRLRLVLLTVACLAASALYAAETSTANGTHHVGTRPVVASTHTSTPHRGGSKAVTHRAASRSATRRGANPHAGSASYAGRKTASHGTSASNAKQTLGRTTGYVSPRKGSAARNRRSRTSPTRVPTGQRWARLHLQPERVDEIQQALIRESYLAGDTTGEWDSRTRDAMLRYQTMHGFPPTGLPEAKSLMKLGLGSHPLPPELDHGSVGIASSGSTRNVFSVSPSTPPGFQTAPPALDAAPPITK